MDSQSAKTTGVGGQPRGFDGGKRKVRGIKRHLLVHLRWQNAHLTLGATVHRWASARTRGKSLIELPSEVLDAFGLEAAQDLPGAVGDLAGETGETSDVDAV